jgi:hypothetical protein
MKWARTMSRGSHSFRRSPGTLSNAVRRRFLEINALMVLVFWMIYYNLGQEHFNGDFHTPMDALYYTVVTHVTLGYGDISPKTQLARRIVTLHILLVWAEIVIFSTPLL